MFLTLNNGRVIEIKSAKTFMHGLGLKVVYMDNSKELFCYLEWVSVMRKN